MEFTAIYRNASMSPSKVKGVANLIRGKHVNDALQILRRTNKRASYMIDKVLRSAMANADESLEADMESLWVKAAHADMGSGKGPGRRRYRPRARGRMDLERHRYSHITIVLADSQ